VNLVTVERMTVILLCAVLVAACASPASMPPGSTPFSSAPLGFKPTGSAADAGFIAAQWPGTTRYLLLGEVHDNPAHHALRAAQLQRMLARGERFALLMEQFDRERQGDIDRARRERPSDADYLISQASPRPTRPGALGWDWPQYRPFVELALRYDLPLVAANVSRADLMRMGKEGFAAVFSSTELAVLGLDRPLPADLQAAQEGEILRGHCNALPTQALPGMARAQMARDAFMALKLREHERSRAVLIAGNGHVRRDLGVPRWLPRASEIHVVGLGEETASPSTAPRDETRYDEFIVTAATARPDPCEAFLRSRRQGATPASN
jgi:uncharacterized iron-regulated protein